MCAGVVAYFVLLAASWAEPAKVEVCVWAGHEAVRCVVVVVAWGWAVECASTYDVFGEVEVAALWAVPVSGVFPCCLRSSSLCKVLVVQCSPFGVWCVLWWVKEAVCGKYGCECVALHVLVVGEEELVADDECLVGDARCLVLCRVDFVGDM